MKTVVALSVLALNRIKKLCARYLSKRPTKIDRENPPARLTLLPYSNSVAILSPISPATSILGINITVSIWLTFTVLLAIKTIKELSALSLCLFTYRRVTLTTKENQHR